jgi:hypothetical protein
MFDFLYQIDAVSKLDESSGAVHWSDPGYFDQHLAAKISLFNERLKPAPETALSAELSILRRGRMPQNGGDLRFSCQLRRLADRSCH